MTQIQNVTTRSKYAHIAAFLCSSARIRKTYVNVEVYRAPTQSKYAENDTNYIINIMSQDKSFILLPDIWRIKN
jgi:hypothetical protein